MLPEDRREEALRIAADLRDLEQRMREITAKADELNVARSVADSCRAMLAIDRRSSELRARARELLQELERLALAAATKIQAGGPTPPQEG